MRAYLTNKHGFASQSTISATFEIPAGTLVSGTWQNEWRVRTWDNRIVNVAWHSPFIDHPGGQGPRTVVATWVDTLPVGLSRGIVEMVGGTNVPPTFQMTAETANLVSNGEIWLTYTDMDPVWAATGPRSWTSRSQTEVAVDVLASARQGAVQGRPGRIWEFSQRGLVRIYHAVTSIGPGSHHDWMGNTVQGLLYVHVWLRVANGQNDAQMQMLLANTAQFPLPSDRPDGEDGRPTEAQWLERPMSVSLSNLRIRFACNGLTNLQARPWGVWNFATGEGPAVIASIDGIGNGQGRHWQLPIEGLRRPGRYPFFFGLAYGNTVATSRSFLVARNPLNHVGWGSCEEMARPLRIGNFAGEFSSFGIAAGGWEYPPPIVSIEKRDAWFASGPSRYTDWLAQRVGFGGAFVPCPFFPNGGAGHTFEQPNDPWRLLGYPHGPGNQGGDQKQIYHFKGGRAVYGNVPELLTIQAFEAARAHAMYLGVHEMRNDERSQARNPGTIPHTVPYGAWFGGPRNMLFTRDSVGPSREAGVKHGMWNGTGNGATRPVYPQGSTNPARPDNPDMRETFPRFDNLEGQRWQLNEAQHWGVARMNECVRACPDMFPLLEHLLERHADNAYFGCPDGHQVDRTLRDSGSGGGTRARVRFWETMERGRVVTNRQAYVDRFLEMVWRMQNDGSGYTWLVPFQEQNAYAGVDRLRINGVGTTTYNMTQHVHFAWQAGLGCVFFANMAYEVAHMTGATEAYPGVANLREVAAEHVARVFRNSALMLIRDCFGIPASRLGLTTRLLDESVDWNEYPFGLIWHRWQGFGAETPLGEGGQPTSLNRCLGGITGQNFGPGRNGSGEEKDIYPALIASRVWDADPLFTADIRARREYIIQRLEVLEPGLHNGDDYDNKGMTVGGGAGGGAGWSAQGVAQPNVGVSVEPVGGQDPLSTTVTLAGIVTGDPRSHVIRLWWDWNDGNPNALADELVNIDSVEFQERVQHVFSSGNTVQRRYTVRAVLFGPAGALDEARANVAVNAVPPTAGFDVLGATGFAPHHVTLRSTATGTITRTSYVVSNDETGETLSLEGSEVEFTLPNPGIYSVLQQIEGPAGSPRAQRRQAISVLERIAPIALATFTPNPLSGTAPRVIAVTNQSNMDGEIWFGITGELPVKSVPGQVHNKTYGVSGNYTIVLSAVNGAGDRALWTTPIAVGVPDIQQESIGELPTLVLGAALPEGTVRTSRPKRGSKGTLKPIGLSVDGKAGTVRKGTRGTLPALGLDATPTAGSLDRGVRIVGEAIGMDVALPDGEVRKGSGGRLPPLSASLHLPSGRIRRGVRIVQDEHDIPALTAFVPRGLARGRRGVRIVGEPIALEANIAGRGLHADNGGRIAYVQQAEPLGLDVAVPPGNPVGGFDGLQVVRRLPCSLVFTRRINARIPVVQQQNIQGFVVGSGERWEFPLQDANGVALNPTTLRNCRAKLHIFDTNLSEVPRTTMRFELEPLADGGPLAFRQLLRYDTAGKLEIDSTYWYRLEIETLNSDRDLPACFGSLQTAAQPAMLDDEA